jgi:hypothetical protein
MQTSDLGQGDRLSEDIMCPAGFVAEPRATFRRSRATLDPRLRARSHAAGGIVDRIEE